MNYLNIREDLLNTLEEDIKNSKTNMRIANLMYAKFLISMSSTKEELLAEDKDVVSKDWIERFYRELVWLLDLLENTLFFDFDTLYNLFKGLSEKLLIIREHKKFEEFFDRIVNL